MLAASVTAQTERDAEREREQGEWTGNSNRPGRPGMGKPGLAGSFAKNQRRGLMVVNTVLLVLGFWIWGFVGGLMEDALLRGDVRLGWVLWLSWVARAGTIVLSVVGCWGNLHSNNVLFGYATVCLVEFAMLCKYQAICRCL